MEYDKKLDVLYTIAVMRYKENNPDFSMDVLFPVGWHSSKNYKLKIEILAEAINQGILIIDTQLYREKFLGILGDNKKI